jgi:NADPH:quinone reductase-like Zn-dependent oxidoreductase
MDTVVYSSTPVKAVVISSFGGPEVLSYREWDDPTPGPDEALVTVEAAAVNHLDLDLRDGTSRLPIELPHVTGLEGVGRVRTLPADYEGPLSPGNRVLIVEELSCGVCRLCRIGRPNLCQDTDWMGVSRPGTYAELVAVPVSGLIALPEQRSSAEWATVQGSFGTAWHMLVTRGQVRPDEWVLVNGVGSGIGTGALQLALLAGAKVIASAGSDAKLERALEQGASAGINYSRESIRDVVMKVTGGIGVDLVYEHIGGRIFSESVLATRLGGRVVTCGAHAGEVADLDIIELFRAERTIIGSMACTFDEVEHVVNLVASGTLNPVIDREIPLSMAAEAHRILAGRQAFGKLVLVPDGVRR